MILIRGLVDFWMTSIREKATLATSPTYRDVDQQSRLQSRSKAEAYLHTEQQGQEERHCRLQCICLCARSPVERDFVRNL